MIDAADRSGAVATEEVIRRPAERCRLLSPTVVEELPAIFDESLPAPLRHIAGRAIRIKPGESLGPGVRDTAVIFDDRRALLLGLAPACGRCLPKVAFSPKDAKDGRLAFF